MIMSTMILNMMSFQDQGSQLSGKLTRKVFPRITSMKDHQTSRK